MGFQFVYPSAEPSIIAPLPARLTVSFWRRAVALWIDGMLIGGATGVLDKLSGAMPQWPAWAWIFGILSWAVMPVYYILAYSTTGQTPGKKSLNIKVVSIDGSPLNWRKGVLRFIGSYLSDFSFGLGYLWSIRDKEKQTWHDKIAGTRVVPAWITAEQVSAAFDQIQLRKRPNTWKWVAASTVVIELALVACIGFAMWQLSLQSPVPTALHDDEWGRFENALMTRVNPDSRIPEFGTHRDFNLSSGEVAEVWLHMEMTYDADCEMGSESPSDWCYRLANELVKIVFDNYPHINEIAGIQVEMTRVSGVGPVTFNYTPVNHALTIAEWRKRLGIPAP